MIDDVQLILLDQAHYFLEGINLGCLGLHQGLLYVLGEELEPLVEQERFPGFINCFNFILQEAGPPISVLEAARLWLGWARDALLALPRELLSEREAFIWRSLLHGQDHWVEQVCLMCITIVIENIHVLPPNYRALMVSDGLVYFIDVVHQGVVFELPYNLLLILALIWIGQDWPQAALPEEVAVGHLVLVFDWFCLISVDFVGELRLLFENHLVQSNNLARLQDQRVVILLIDSPQMGCYLLDVLLDTALDLWIALIGVLKWDLYFFNLQILQVTLMVITYVDFTSHREVDLCDLLLLALD